MQTYNLEYSVDLHKYLPEWVSVGFSAATRECFQKNNVKSWSFSSNLQHEVDDPVPNNVSVLDSRPSGRKMMKLGEVIRLVVGLSALVLLLILLGFWFRLRRKKTNKNGEEEESLFDMSMEMEFEKGSGPKRFSYKELLMATDNFAEEFKLREGGFGGV
ncbi:hypothetical protein C2S51_030455 [Perilla frutescens var. frutescens]|nr:hypothetical protein C2S51_030455 [Perilla frutescens var. frutescens]